MNAREVFEKRLRQAVKASAREVQEYAQENHRFTSKTGELERAIDVRQVSDFTAEVYIDSNVANYGPFVHNGTKAHIIRPKVKKALRWVPQGGNAFIFARRVRHPGTRSDPFLYKALEAKQEAIKGIFSKAVNVALDDIAKSVISDTKSINIKIKL